jgi:ribosomal protein S18 acetylase RimI-like enzyme
MSTPPAASAIELRRATVADAAALANLHASEIDEGFLVALGGPFLRRIYRRAVLSSRAFAIAAVDGERVVGFVAAAEETRAFYREFLSRDAIVAGLVALPRIARSPRRVWETLRYGVRDDGDDLPDAEIFAVAVDPSQRGVGVGGRLVVAALDELEARGIVGARVVAAAGNGAALRMYRGAGFRNRATIEVHRDVPQEVLVWP